MIDFNICKITSKLIVYKSYLLWIQGIFYVVVSLMITYNTTLLILGMIYRKKILPDFNFDIDDSRQSRTPA